MILLWYHLLNAVEWLTMYILFYFFLHMHTYCRRWYNVWICLSKQAGCSSCLHQTLFRKKQTQSHCLLCLYLCKLQCIVTLYYENVYININSIIELKCLFSWIDTCGSVLCTGCSYSVLSEKKNKTKPKHIFFSG